MKANIVTPEDVADATGRSVEDVEESWRDIASKAEVEEVEEESSPNERNRLFSDD